MPLNSLEMAHRGRLAQSGQIGLNSLEMGHRGLLNVAVAGVVGVDLQADINFCPVFSASPTMAAIFTKTRIETAPTIYAKFTARAKLLSVIDIESE